MARARSIPEPSDPLVTLHADISSYLDRIAFMFTRPELTKITLVVRTPWLGEGKEGDVLLTNDDLEMAIAAIRRLHAKEPVAGPEAKVEENGHGRTEA